MELESPQLLASLLVVLLAAAAAVHSSPTPEAIQLPTTAGHAQQACAAAAVHSSPTPEAIRLPSAAEHSQQACAADAQAQQACAAALEDRPTVSEYDRPIIGILTHPGDGTYERRTYGPGSYIASSYVRFVQSAGARLVPLLYDEPQERLLEKLGLVNGVLFTGGSQKNGSYFETIKRVFQYVLDRNDAGDPFPLHAECLGFELISMIVSKDNNILEPFDALNQTSTLQFPNHSFLEGSVFQSMVYHQRDCKKILHYQVSSRFLPRHLMKMARSMSQLYKHRIIQSSARSGILRKPFLSGGSR